MLDGIIYAKGRKPSSAGMAGATTAGLERLEVAAGLEAGGGGGSEGRRRVSLVQLSSVVLRWQRREHFFLFFWVKSEMCSPARLILKCNARHSIGDAPAMRLTFYLRRVSACIFLRSVCIYKWYIKIMLIGLAAIFFGQFGYVVMTVTHNKKQTMTFMQIIFRATHRLKFLEVIANRGATDVSSMPGFGSGAMQIFASKWVAI
jgi:hypothetical protein